MKEIGDKKDSEHSRVFIMTSVEGEIIEAWGCLVFPKNFKKAPSEEADGQPYPETENLRGY